MSAASEFSSAEIEAGRRLFAQEWQFASAASSVIVLGGDVPPDVTSGIPPVLIGRGTRDDRYANEKFEKDFTFLSSVTTVSSCVYDGGHEWTDDFRGAAGEFLARLADSSTS